MSTVIVGMALAVSACSGAAQTATPVPATPTVSPATAAPATAAPATAAPTRFPVAAAVSFDGETCKYSGPTVIPRDAEVTFTMSNTPAAVQGPSGAAALIVLPVLDGTTWEFIVADLEATDSISASDPAYAFLPGIGYGAIQILYPDSGSQTLQVVTTRDLDYLVMCGTPPETTDAGFPAILLEIMPKA